MFKQESPNNEIVLVDHVLKRCIGLFIRFISASRFLRIQIDQSTSHADDYMNQNNID